MQTPGTFEITARDKASKARTGRLTTAHGVGETPVFMPVATQATVKALSDADIREAATIGVRGVPFFVIENKYGVSGAQPSEVFAQALETVLAEQGPG